MTDTPAQPGEPPDDVRHFMRVASGMGNDPAIERMGHAVDLLGEGLAMVPRPDWEHSFPNEFSAVACLGRVYRQLRAATTLALWGYYAEVRLVLRAVYESAALSRMLAKEPLLAEKWLRKEHWFPDREVRKWMSGGENVLGDAEEITREYASAYRAMSAWGHPTAISCAEVVRPDPNDPSRPGLHLTAQFDEVILRRCVTEITVTAIFACFAFRNAVVDERAIDSDWRRRLYEFAPEALDRDMTHLQRDWDEEQRHSEALRERVQSAKDIAERLHGDPLSWENLKAKDSSPQS
jgi:hypothetical protein